MSFFIYSLAENKFIYFNKLLPFNMKSINPIQKYPHIIESCACILQIFVIFLFLMNFLISFGICSNPKLSKCVTFLGFAYKGIPWLAIDLYPSTILMYVLSFILDKLILE